MAFKRVSGLGGGSRRGSTIPAIGGAMISSLQSNRGGRPAPKHAVFRWRQEMLDENSNGTDLKYTLAHKPIYALTVTLYINGLLQRQGIDYHINDREITLTEAPWAGSNILVKYNAISMER